VSFFFKNETKVELTWQNSSAATETQEELGMCIWSLWLGRRIMWLAPFHPLFG